MTKLLVAGGRDFLRKDIVEEVLDDFLKNFGITEICQGGASGADTLAMNWALDRGIPVMTYMADWRTHGKAAGHMRNQAMLEDFKPEMALFFPGGKGTSDMRRRCDKDPGVLVIADITVPKSDVGSAP